MSICCIAFASTGQHDKSCMMGLAGSEAAPEQTSRVEAVMRQLTPEDRAKITAQLDALIEANKTAQLNALRGYIKSKDAHDKGEPKP